MRFFFSFFLRRQCSDPIGTRPSADSFLINRTNFKIDYIIYHLEAFIRPSKGPSINCVASVGRRDSPKDNLQNSRLLLSKKTTRGGGVKNFRFWDDIFHGRPLIRCLLMPFFMPFFTIFYRQCSDPIGTRPSADSFWPAVICGGYPWVITLERKFCFHQNRVHFRSTIYTADGMWFLKVFKFPSSFRTNYAAFICPLQ